LRYVFEKSNNAVAFSLMSSRNASRSIQLGGIALTP
jgi:hypothetical protein